MKKGLKLIKMLQIWFIKMGFLWLFYMAWRLKIATFAEGGVFSRIISELVVFDELMHFLIQELILKCSLMILDQAPATFLQFPKILKDSQNYEKKPKIRD